MGITKAFGKAIASSINNALSRYRIKKAGKTAYDLNGQEMKKARKKGKHFNGSKRYREIKQEILQKEQDRKETTKTFIDSL